MKIFISLILTLVTTNSVIAGLPRIDAAGAGPNGQGHFIIKSTGSPFVPRGANYIAETGGLHDLFAPAVYNAVRVESDLAQLENDGYNMVRVFMENNPAVNRSIGNPMTEGGLNAAWLDNVADLILRAQNHNIYVMPVLTYFPNNSYYFGIANNPATLSDPGYLDSTLNPNSFQMNRGHILAKQQYVEDFILAIKSRIGAGNMSTIFAYGIENEMFFSLNYFPFNHPSGTIGAANGLTYDMASLSDRQQATDALGVEFAISVTDAIKAVDPDAMTTMGLFTYAAAGVWGPDGLNPSSSLDHRRPGRASTLTTYANMDFIGIHHYPYGTYDTYSLATDLASYEYAWITGPVMMSEFGAAKVYYPTISAAAFGMRDLQVESCNFNYSGWLFWSFETPAQPHLYHLMDSAGAINGQLAPIVRPDPCLP